MNHVKQGCGWNLLVALFAACAGLGCEGNDRTARTRRPQWPLKTARTLLTDEQIARARHLCETDEAATAVRQGICDAAAYWTAIPDGELRRRLPDAGVPRAFNVSTEGCPEHGKAVYQHGTYPWKLDRERPFVVICPVGGERYPSNDFDADGNAQTTGPYIDTGRGWLAPNGARYWFVAYACHWHWMNTWLPTVRTLSQAYVLTGDPLYARKAVVMLDRIAEVYPGMDYNTQCRMAVETGGQQRGKIVNSIWETDVLRDLAIAYDQVFDALVGEHAITLPLRTAKHIRANIEANLLEEGIDAVNRHDIYGNFGMHQAALAYAAVVRQHGPTRKLLDGIFTRTGLETNHEGLDYALYNLVYKDGMPVATSPLYCFTRLDSLVSLARPLSAAGINLYEHPKMRRLFDAPLQMVCADDFTPAIGDAGTITSGWIGPNANTYATAYRQLRRPEYAWAVKRLRAAPGKRFETFDDLFDEPLADDPTLDPAYDGGPTTQQVSPASARRERAQMIRTASVRKQPGAVNVAKRGGSTRGQTGIGPLPYGRGSDRGTLSSPPEMSNRKRNGASHHHRPRSRVLDGYGLAVLNNPSNSVAAAIYYGMRDPHHGHFDRLNIELFGRGRRLSPDLGYPDFMNDLVPGIHTWTKNTVSHNTVVVDESRQGGYRPAKVLRLHDSPTVHVVDVDAFGTYAQTDIYRRTLVLVDVGPNDAYLVDVFRVRGGENHTLSIHGPDGEFRLEGASLSPPVSEGTLAGRNVAYGALYDDPVRGDPGYHGSYAAYEGSGFQHFFNWQRATPDAVVTGQWQLKGNPTAQLRVHVAPHPRQELIVADAYVSPSRKTPTTLKYMLLRRSADESGNTFVTVWEPASTDALIDRVEVHDAPSLGTGHDRAVALTVHRAESVDTVVVGNGDGRLISFAPNTQSDATIAVISEQDGKPTRLFVAGGTKLTDGKRDRSIAIPSTIAGEIRSVDYADSTIVVATPSAHPEPATLMGRTVRIFNERHSCVYTIADAQTTGSGLRITLTGSAIFTGRIRVYAVDPGANSVTTYTCLPHRHRLVGMHLVTEDLAHAAPIAGIEKTAIQLAPGSDIGPFASSTASGGRNDVWVADFGVGDRIEIARLVHHCPERGRRP